MRKIYYGIPVLVLGLFLLQCSDNSPVGPASLAPSGMAKGSAWVNVVVVLQDDIANVDGTVASLEMTYGMKRKFTYKHAIKGFSAPLRAAKLDELRADLRVKSVEEDFVVEAFAQTLPWGIDRIDADLSSTKAGDGVDSVRDVRIYVIDTGIQPDHPDLFVAGGKNFTTTGTDLDWADDNGHGTHVSGTVAARDNSSHVVGVAPGAELYAIKVLNSAGSGYSSWIIAGIDYVTAQKSAQPLVPMVANMSLGAKTNTTAYNAMDLAVLRSIQAGVICAIAAGNEGKDAKYSTPAHVVEAITVGAYDSKNILANFSNYGPLVDILAPGVGIVSTYPGSSTYSMSGTSMATPHVAGAAALLLSGSPELTPAQVRDQLVTSGLAAVSMKRRLTTNKTVWVGAY